jgi:hypothetical protein
MSDQSLPTLDAAALKQLPTDLSLALNYIRLNPAALNDSATLLYFIRANNCGNPQIDKLLRDEFESPQILKFYKSNAAQILSALQLPTFEWTSNINFGQYDLARGAFQLPVPVSYRQMDVDIGAPCRGGAADRDLYSVTRNFFSGSLPGSVAQAKAEVEVKPFEISWIPMAQDAARDFVARVDQNRHLTMVAQIEVLPARPAYMGPVMTTAGYSKPTAHFTGHIVSLVAYDRYPGGTVMASFDPNNLPNSRGK